MRNQILVALALATAALIAAPGARADTRTYWDDGKAQWIVADDTSAAFKRLSRSKIPREMVAYDGPYSTGSIIVDTEQRRLYYVVAPGKAIKYAIGVGREGYQWSGTDVITNKAEWPTWKPPAEMIDREKAKGHILQPEMPGGLDNPLGARALYIGFGLYRIHGTTDPRSVGHAVSSGCIRLTNEDITDLYDRVRMGTRVVVLLKSPLVVAKAEPTNSTALVPRPRINPIVPKILAKAVGPVKEAPKTIAALRKPVGSTLAKTAVKAVLPGVVTHPVEVWQKDDVVTGAVAPSAEPVEGSDKTAGFLAGVTKPEEFATNGPPASH